MILKDYVAEISDGRRTWTEWITARHRDTQLVRAEARRTAGSRAAAKGGAVKALRYVRGSTRKVDQ